MERFTGDLVAYRQFQSTVNLIEHKHQARSTRRWTVTMWSRRIPNEPTWETLLRRDSSPPSKTKPARVWFAHSPEVIRITQITRAIVIGKVVLNHVHFHNPIVGLQWRSTEKTEGNNVFSPVFTAACKHRVWFSHNASSVDALLDPVDSSQGKNKVATRWSWRVGARAFVLKAQGGEITLK